MLTELVESIRKPDEKMKLMLRETKENVQGTNNDGKETRTQINKLEQKGEITFKQNRMKKQEFKNTRSG